VLAAVAAGVTGPRVKQLRAEYGRTLATYDKRLYITSLNELLAHHRDDLVGI
jgi:hypothetical protein